MKTEINITVRAYPVELLDERTGKKVPDTIVLDKARLQAGAMVGMDDKDIIYRIYNRQGYKVLSIDKPDKVEITVDLYDAYFKAVMPGIDTL